MELIEKLGIDWKLLIGQLVNFAILLIILHRFVYRPVLRALQKRTDTIEQSLVNAKQIEENLTVSESEKDSILAKARQQAREIITEAMKTAEASRSEKLHAAAKEVEEIIMRARGEINQAKETMLKEVRTEVADLVVAASEKIMSEKIADSGNAKYIDEVVSAIAKKSS